MDATTIFTEHSVALERLATRITRDAEEARDVAADAFAALLASGPSDPDHAVPWLYLTVRHRAYNWIRRQVMAERRLPAFATEVDPALAPESAVRTDPHLRALLATATAHLKERDRLAISMRHVEQASYEDIAAVLGTTVTQARVVVHRANARLRRYVVASLSRHHADACVDSRVKAGTNDRCSGCSSVSEELATLLQVPAVLPLGHSTRARQAVRDWWRRAQATTGRVAMYAGDVIGPGVALVAMTSGSVAPVPTAPAESSVLESASAMVPRLGERGVPSADLVPIDLSSAPPAAGHVAARETIGSPLRIDDPGRSARPPDSFHVQPLSLLTVLGLPVDLPDPLDVPSFPEIDIRSFELATLADDRGRPRALRWRIELASPPTPAVSKISLDWGYEGTECFTTFTWPSAPELRVLTACPVVPLVDVGVVKVHAAERSSPVESRVDGPVLEATLPFASLDRTTRTFLYPGARMLRIAVTATCPNQDPSTCPTFDRAPDKGGYTYQVEK